MKLLIVTVVEELEEDVLKLFKKAKIENFSESHIDGFKNQASVFMATNWFPSEKSGVKSSMFFSFTDEEKINTLFELIKDYNKELETNNPIRAIIVPIEKSI